MGNKHSVDFKTGRKSRGLGLSLNTSYKAPKGSGTVLPPSTKSRSIEDLRAEQTTARRAVSVQSLHEPSANTDYRRSQTNTQTLPHPRPKTVAGDFTTQNSTTARETSVLSRQSSVPSRQASTNDTAENKPKNGEPYINTDLKKVFKENEKKGRVHLDDVDENLNETDLLDKKLETLKRQKNGNATIIMETDSKPKSNGVKDFATVASVATVVKKRVRKSKPAPRPATMQPQTTTTLKKKAAPKPPVQSTRPVTSIENTNSNNNNHEITIEEPITVSTVTQVEAAPVEPMSPPRDALMRDLQQTLSIKSEKDTVVKEDSSHGRASTEFDSRRHHSRREDLPPKSDRVDNASPNKHPTQSVRKELNQPDVKSGKEETAHDWLVKNSYAHPLSTGTQVTRAVVIERELTSKPNRKVKKRPQTPTDPIPHEIAAALEEMSAEAVSVNTSSAEIGTQANAPVNMGVQCSGETLKARKAEEEKEKLGNVLKLFIDHNAEKESTRSPDVPPNKGSQNGSLERVDVVVAGKKKIKIEENAMIMTDMDADIDLDSEPEQVVNASVKEDITLHKAVVVQTSVDESMTGTSTLNGLQKSDSGVVVKTENEVESPRIDAQPSPVSVDQDSGHEDSASPESPNSENGAIDGKRNKNKKKFVKITKSMKSMKNFMSSSLKSGAKKSRKTEGSSEDADDEGVQINENWTLSRTKKPENSAWYQDAYQQPSEKASTPTVTETAGERSNTSVKRHSSNLALMSPKGWAGNSTLSNTYRPVSMNFNTKSAGAGISAEDLY